MGFWDKLFGRKETPVRAARFGVEELARRLGMTPEALRAVVPEYRQVTIPKRRGGMRTLHVPAPPLKAVQRTILRRLLGRLRAHPAVRGFEKGQSIVTNAAPHVGRAVVVKMDLQDFFPTTQAQRVEAFFGILGWDAAAAKLLAGLCTHERGLPQGAPTSPRLSTLVNYPLDARLAKLAARYGAVYTRYADDMTFSFAGHGAAEPVPHVNPKTLAQVPPEASANLRSQVAMVIRETKEIVREYGYKLHQKKKLQIRRAHDRQLVTGLVVNARVDLPREKRRWLRAVEHRLRTGGKATLTLEQYAGWVALRTMIAAQRSTPDVAGQEGS